MCVGYVWAPKIPETKRNSNYVGSGSSSINLRSDVTSSNVIAYYIIKKSFIVCFSYGARHAACLI